MSRCTARNSSHNVGIFAARDGAVVYSVRLTDKCVHDSEHHEVAACGHSWCRLCLGYFSPVTKVVLCSASNIVACNRKVASEYEHYFELVALHTYCDFLFSVMTKLLGKSKVFRLEMEIARNPSDEICSWTNYERHKGRASSS